MNKVSVIVNSFNEKESFFKKTIESILDNRNVELQIVVSTVYGDNCIDYVKDYNLTVVINKKPGIFQQINNTIEHLTGDYITYFSSNDYMSKYKLQIESEMLKQSGKKVCYSTFNKIDIDGKKNIKTFHNYSFEKHLIGNFVSDCSMIKKDIFMKYTPFNISYGNHAFHDFWLRIYKGEGDVFIYNQIPTWDYIITENSSHFIRSKNPQKKLENELSREKMLKTHKLNI
jgi:hypothetical protein